MKILHVVHSLDPGGMENGVCNIARGLATRRFETHVACLERRGAFAERLPAPQNVHLMGKGQGFSLRATWTLWRTMARLQPDVVHTHNLGPLVYTSLATFGGWTRRIVHGEHSQLAAWELEPRRLRQRRKLYRRCAAIHTVSSGQLEELHRLGFSHPRLLSIPNGVDTEHFSPQGKAEARARFGLPADAIAIGLVGRFGPFKRHDVLLRAFAALAVQFPAAHLVFAGAGGSEETRIRELAATSEFRNRIHLIGFQPDPAPCYRALDLLAIPSTNEGMSNAALEAMASGVAVLGNISCGHDQMITSGTDGVIADLSTDAALAQQLSEMLAAPQRLVDMGQSARITVTRRFSMSSMLDAYEQLYRASGR
jgi:glycosyltransferase involved in cell wall biosynthesis